MTGSGPEADHLSHQMMDAWIAFARHGDPTHDGIGPWPAYEPVGRPTMIFGRASGAEAAPFEEERQMWAALLDRAAHGTAPA
jgi:para-nitrobenzyl esterase